MTPPQDKEPSQDLRAYEEPHEAEPTPSFFEARWWRWVGIGVAALVVLSFTLPLLAPFFAGNDDPQPPSSSTTRMPDFLLPAAGGGTIRLSEETRRNDAVVLVFYRGYF